jgi:hypothetical protein
MDKTCSMHDKDNSYIILVRKPQGKRQSGRPKCNWRLVKECSSEKLGV